MNWSLEQNMRRFTKYVNKRLRDSIIIDTWGIYISGEDKYEVYIEIDYIDNFHSRDIYRISPVSEFDILRLEFDHNMTKHLTEYRQQIYGRKDE